MQYWNENDESNIPCHIEATMGIPFSSFISSSVGIKRNRTAILRILKMNTKSCSECHEWYPGWVLDEDKIRVVVDKKFTDPKQYFAVHCDHELITDTKTGLLKAKVPPGEKYINPSALTNFSDADRVTQHLLCTDTLCAG